jgi:DNA (cytosine-5)-methyltransferase 1
MYEPTHIDLFSGIGGFALAAKWAGFRTIAFCEIDPYCRKVLAQNFMAKPYIGNGNSERNEGAQADTATNPQRGAFADIRGSGSLPRVTANIFDFDGTAYRGASLLTGGFPCQPFSVAGKRRGAADDRHLWPEMLRVIKEARPAWVLGVGENVPGIIPMELDNVLSDLESIGYATRSFVIPACAVDARHRRDRLWIICRDVSNSNEQRLEGQRQIACGTGTQLNDAGNHCRWQPEPDVGRVAHGIPSRVDRLRGLGNAIVPQVAFEILLEIRKLI